MSDHPPLTAAESAAMLAEAERRQAEFDEWARRMIGREIRPEGDEQRAAHKSGWKAGRLRLAEADRKRAAAPFLHDAYLAVAWSCGYGEGRAMPKTTPEELAAAEARKAELFAMIRERNSRG